MEENEPNQTLHAPGPKPCWSGADPTDDGGLFQPFSCNCDQHAPVTVAST